MINFYFLLLALVAEILGTVGGFGSSVFFVPIGGFYFDFQTVLGLTAVFHLGSNLSKIYLFKEGFNKKLLINIGVPSVIFVVIGGVLSAYVDSKVLNISLGVFLVSISLLFLIKKDLVIPPKLIPSISGGAASGLAAGLLGTGGAIRGLTMAAFNLEKSVFLATSAMIDLMVDFSRAIVYFANGFIHKQTLYYLPFLLLIGFGGTWIGKKLLAYLPQEKFKQLSLALILLIGVVTFVKVIFPDLNVQLD